MAAVGIAGNDLLQSAPAWIVLLAVVGYVFQTFSFAPFLRWVANRHKEQLVFINSQLKDAIDLNPKMREHLLRRRDRLILLTTVGVAVDPPIGEAIITLMEDQTHGIRWSNLELADRYLILKSPNKIGVRVGWIEVLRKSLNLLPCFVCFIFYLNFAFAVINSLTRSANGALLDIAQITRDSVLALIFLFTATLFWYPIAQILAAWQVQRRLKKHEAKQHTSIPESIPDRTSGITQRTARPGASVVRAGQVKLSKD